MLLKNINIEKVEAASINQMAPSKDTDFTLSTKSPAAKVDPERRITIELNEIEEMVNIKVPFPILLSEEENKESVEYKVATDEQGEFSAYHYNLSTPERNYDVWATNNVDAKVKLTAETTDGTAIEKDIVINGTSSKLLGINEIDGYSIYIENENWKMIISCFDRGNSLEGLSDVKEEEIIKIAESISW